jgi:acyl dehydratase
VIISAVVLTLDAYQAKIGTEIGVSAWLHITQEMINQFADVTGDHQYIHVDVARASQTPFGGTIAHGLLSLSLLPVFANGALPKILGAQMGINYGFNKVRFVSPVKSGARLRGRFTLQSVTEPKPGQMLSKTEVTVEIEGEAKPALVAEWLSLTIV